MPAKKRKDSSVGKKKATVVKAGARAVARARARGAKAKAPSLESARGRSRVPSKVRASALSQKESPQISRKRTINTKSAVAQATTKGALPMVTEVRRGDLPTIVDHLTAGKDGRELTCNLVDVLELLLDAGQNTLCTSLASQAAATLGGDSRKHLFDAYRYFSGISIFGSVSSSIKKIARAKALVDGTGASLEDSIRVGMLLARAKIHGVAVSCLSEIQLQEARSSLAIEFERAIEAKLVKVALAVGLDILRLHLHGPQPDPVSAAAISKVLLELASDCSVRDEQRFDLHRNLFYLPTQTTGWSGISISEEVIRQQAHELGVLTEALVELATLRRDGSFEEGRVDALEAAYAVCQSNGHILGAFEIAYRLAAKSLSDHHLVRAERWYRAAHDNALLGGFMHGRYSSLLGLYQCSLFDTVSASGSEIHAKVLRDLEAAASSEIGMATVGLSVGATFQTSGKYRQGEEFLRGVEQFFYERSLVKLCAQAAFSAGACCAGGGDWDGAYSSWKRSMEYELQLGDEIGIAEKRGAMAQAIAMQEFSKTRTISEAGMIQVRELLDGASELLAETVSSPDHIRAEAKILQCYAQLSIIGQVPVEALKHLQRARNLYLALEMPRETALMDALSGLALLEVAKKGSPQMYEEAGLSLQRALQFFSSADHIAIRWKIKYYLALASYFHSQTKTRDEDKFHWRAAAAEWLRGALADSELVRGGVLGAGRGAESDFSPGLGAEAMDPLKVVLGITPRPAAKKKRKKSTEKVSLKRRSFGQVH